MKNIGQQQNQHRSAWEEGLDMIESLLEVGSPSEAAMSTDQRDGLKKLKRMLLLSGVHSMESHIPNSLLQMNAMSSSSSSSSSPSSLPSSTTSSSTTTYDVSDGDDSRRFLLSNFGGYTPPEEDAGDRFKQIVAAHKVARKLFTRAAASRSPVMISCDENGAGPPLPALWKTLDGIQQNKLKDLLQWDNLCRWDFDVFEVNDIVGGQEGKEEGGTLVFIAWAILASPHAQYSMEYACNSRRNQEQADGTSQTTTTEESNDDGSGGVLPPLNERKGYQFCEHFGIREETLVEFLDAIESRYVQENPYHNSIHAADVLQTLHAMLQSGGMVYAIGSGDGDHRQTQVQYMELFGLLLAAVIHDVGHPGLNNLFQVHSRSDLALLYNDISVLENMHLATAFQLILGEDRDERVDIFESLTDEQISVVRDMMVKSVLATDMTQHFAKNDYVKGILMTQVDDDAEEYNKRNASATSTSTTDEHADSAALPYLKLTADSTMRRHILGYFLHLADISNPTKRIHIGTQWTDRVLEEFFLQGDKEAELALPISPLCCRKTTSRAQSQIGFMTFIVLPSYELLGQLIPSIKTDIIPIIKENLRYWEEQKSIENHNKQVGESQLTVK